MAAKLNPIDEYEKKLRAKSQAATGPVKADKKPKSLLDLYDLPGFQSVRHELMHTIGRTKSDAENFFVRLGQFPGMEVDAELTGVINIAHRALGLAPGEILDTRPLHEQVADMDGLITVQRVMEKFQGMNYNAVSQLLFQMKRRREVDSIGRNAYWNGRGTMPVVEEKKRAVGQWKRAPISACISELLAEPITLASLRTELFERGHVVSQERLMAMLPPETLLRLPTSD